MWEIYEHRRVDKQVANLPIEIIERYEIWKEIVSQSGPQGLKLIRGFKDEALRGEWKGHRSSRLNQQYRVLYQVDGKEVRVEVVSVNAHDYRRR